MSKSESSSPPRSAGSNREPLCGHAAAERDFAMLKAHLFEALYLVNQGVDEAVRGLERLKRSADFNEDVYGEALAKLESRRAHVNLRFFDDMQVGEQRVNMRTKNHAKVMAPRSLVSKLTTPVFASIESRSLASPVVADSPIYSA
jgi:hypothetical protein